MRNITRHRTRYQLHSSSSRWKCARMALAASTKASASFSAPGLTNGKCRGKLREEEAGLISTEEELLSERFSYRWTIVSNKPAPTFDDWLEGGRSCMWDERVRADVCISVSSIKSSMSSSFPSSSASPPASSSASRSRKRRVCERCSAVNYSPSLTYIFQQVTVNHTFVNELGMRYYL